MLSQSDRARSTALAGRPVECRGQSPIPERNMSASVHTIRPQFVAEVRGFSIAAPLSDEDFAVIRQALDDYGVLVFHDQDITICTVKDK